MAALRVYWHVSIKALVALFCTQTGMACAGGLPRTSPPPRQHQHLCSITQQPTLPPNNSDGSNADQEHVQNRNE